MANDHKTSPSGGPAATIAKGVKGYVENLALGGADNAIMPFMFRPNNISEEVTPQYARTRSLGMSFEYMPYEGTGNPGWSFEVYQHRVMILREIGPSGDVAGYFRASQGAGVSTAAGASQQLGRASVTQLSQISAGMEQSKRFLQALLYPPRIGDSQAEAPPACLLVIPGIVSARARLTEWKVQYTQVDTGGALIEWNASVRFEGAPLEQITMDVVLARGLLIARERA
jgi:hypothetical protein